MYQIIAYAMVKNNRPYVYEKAPLKQPVVEFPENKKVTLL